MITLLKNIEWTAEDERHLKFVDPEEMRLVLAENEAQRNESKWGESKLLELRRISNIPLSMYRIPHYRKFFHCGDPDESKRMRKIILERIKGLRASQKI